MLLQDLRYGLRQFRRNPGFAALAILTLGLGIGSVTVIYSVIHNVLLDPFPYAKADRIVNVLIDNTQHPRAGYRGSLSVPEFLDFKEQSGAFEDVAGATAGGMGMYQTAEAVERLAVTSVTANTFDFLGVRPRYGRGLVAGDARADAPPVVVLSHKAWTTYFGSDPAVIGQTLRLDGTVRTIVGVMPPRFTWHLADAWIPGRLDRSDPNAATTRYGFQARLKPGVTIAQAEAALNVIAGRRAQAHPREYFEQFHVRVVTVIDFVVGRFRGVLYTLLGAVGLLLLIACCNVANMLLARATAREKEMTIRAALGASRLRIVRQLLIESLLLAIAGAALGGVLAYNGLEALVRFIPEQTIPFETHISLDTPSLLFSLAIAMLAAILFGLLPAVHAARADLVHGLKDAGKGPGGGFRHGRVRHTIVVAEIALSLVLLLGAGVLMRTFFSLVRVDLGFNPSNILVTWFAFPPGDYPEPARRQFYRDAIARLASVPGVQGAAETTGLPVFDGPQSEVEIPGRAIPDRGTALFRLCSEDYLRVLGFGLARGRFLSAADVQQARKVAVVNQAFAVKYLGAADPLGQQLALRRLETLQPPLPDPVFEIVGVVPNVRNQGLRDDPVPEVYLPSSIAPWGARGILIRTAVDPDRSVNAVRQALRAIDRDVALTTTTPYQTYLRRIYYAQPQFGLIVLGVFACAGFMLVAVGIYGVMAYTVSRQTREIAIRMALGAGRGSVLRLVLRLGAQLTAIGIAAGLAINLWASRLLATQLGEASGHDAVTMTIAVVAIAVMALLACYVPALRAVRVDPMTALRHE